MTGGAPMRPAHHSDSADFWRGCLDEVVRLPRCTSCETFVFPPAPACPHCGGDRLRPHGVAGLGVVYSLTVSHQQLRAGLPAPYAVALVDLVDAPGVRITVRMVGDDGCEVGIGDHVRIEMERHEPDASRPFAVAVARRVAAPIAPGEPSGSAPVTGAEAAPDPATGGIGMARPIDKPESRVVIGGVGRSAVGRRLMRSDLVLTLDAARAAVADAGLTMADIDGLATYPGAGVGPSGYSGPHTHDVARSLGLQLAWHRAGAEGAGQLQPLFDAVLAVAAGLCRNVLVYRTCTESTATADLKAGLLPAPAAAPAEGFMQWLLPFDAITPAQWLAPYQTRHMHEFGTTREQVGAVAVVAREHAALAPDGVFTEPLTLDDYLAARMISSPIGLLDCDVPVDGSVAVIVCRADRTGSLRDGAAVRIEAMGTGCGAAPSWHQWPDLTTMVAHGAAASMWSRTDLRPGDVDTAQLYDGFAFLSLFWLEALGFCGRGEAGAFVEGGDRIRLGGPLPTNTQGGQLSGGRLHGWGFLEEAILQLRGTAHGRQVEGAEVAVVSTGGGPIGGCVLLTGV